MNLNNNLMNVTTQTIACVNVCVRQVGGNTAISYHLYHFVLYNKEGNIVVYNIKIKLFKRKLITLFLWIIKYQGVFFVEYNLKFDIYATQAPSSVPFIERIEISKLSSKTNF